MRAFNQRMANDPDLESIILPVGQGLSIGRVKEKNNINKERLPIGYRRW